MTKPLADRIALVTGASRGIGLAIARGLAESGATVTICGRKQETVDAAVAELGQPAEKVQGVAAPVGKNEDLERLLAAAEKKFGPVNVLVNNAGTNPYFGPILDSDDKAWDKTVRAFRKDLKAMCALVSDEKTDLYAKIPHGDGQTILREALLAADHNAYHVGQLILVRKLLGAWK